MAKGDLREGHHFHFVKVVGPEMVSLPAPGLRKAIESETRRVSSLKSLLEGI